jgi:hypothetical protein
MERTYKFAREPLDLQRLPNLWELIVVAIVEVVDRYRYIGLWVIAICSAVDGQTGNNPKETRVATLLPTQDLAVSRNGESGLFRRNVRSRSSRLAG